MKTMKMEFDDLIELIQRYDMDYYNDNRFSWIHDNDELLWICEHVEPREFECVAHAVYEQENEYNMERIMYLVRYGDYRFYFSVQEVAKEFVEDQLNKAHYKMIYDYMDWYEMGKTLIEQWGMVEFHDCVIELRD